MQDFVFLFVNSSLHRSQLSLCSASRLVLALEEKPSHLLLLLLSHGLSWQGVFAVILDLFVGTHILANEMSKDLSSSNVPPPALLRVYPRRWSSQLLFTVESDACKQTLENCSPVFPRVAMGMKDAFLAHSLDFPGLYSLMHLGHIFPL